VIWKAVQFMKYIGSENFLNMFHTNHKCCYFYFQVPEFYHNFKRCINNSYCRLLMWMKHDLVLTVRFYEYVLPYWTNLTWVHSTLLRGPELHGLICWCSFIRKPKNQWVVWSYSCIWNAVNCIDFRNSWCSILCKKWTVNSPSCFTVNHIQIIQMHL
jgi:hypothetical protein